MNRKIKIGWNISHQEFTIEDHYYFSSVKSEIIKNGMNVREVKEFRSILNYDIVVLNYPEKPFCEDEIEIAREFLVSGGRLIVAGYYNNEDKIADAVNSLSTSFGAQLKKDSVRDGINCLNNDDLLIVTDQIRAYNTGVKKVMFPCCASIKLLDKGINPFIYAGKDNDEREKIIGVEARIGKGEFILIGTCVFWDNYAISKYSNLKFSMNLLLN